MIGRIFKWLITVTSVVILTSLSIDAADHLDNFSDSILGSVVKGVLPAEPPCPEGMTLIDTATGGFCIDAYEASAGEGCLFLNPDNQDETRQNINTPNCLPVSRPGATPWRYVSQSQATLACAKADKRLPTNEEWYTAALGTPDPNRPTRESCNIDKNWREADPGETGSGTECVSAYGAYDMIGNVWEWVTETTANGEYKGRQLPEPGYVSGVDQEGMPITTEKTVDMNYYEDRFWNAETEVTGIFRGGYWGSESDAGLYSVHAEVEPSFVGTGVGFRCVK